MVRQKHLRCRDLSHSGKQAACTPEALLCLRGPRIMVMLCAGEAQKKEVVATFLDWVDGESLSVWGLGLIWGQGMRKIFCLFVT